MLELIAHVLTNRLARLAIERSTVAGGKRQSMNGRFGQSTCIWRGTLSPSTRLDFRRTVAITENTVHAVMPSNMVGRPHLCTMYIYVHDRHATKVNLKSTRRTPVASDNSASSKPRCCHAEHKSFSYTLEPCLTQNRTRTFATLLYSTTRTRQTGRAKSFIDTWTGITTKTRRKQNSTA